MSHTAQLGRFAAWHALTARIGVRLGAAFGLLCLLLVAMAGHAAWQARAMQQQLATALGEHVPVLNQLQQLGREVNTVNLAARDALLSSEPAAADSALQRIENGRTRIGDQIQALQQRLRDSSSKDQQVAEELGNHSSGVLVTLLKFARLTRAGQAEPARALLASALLPKMETLAQTLDQAQALKMQQLDAARALSAAELRRNLIITGSVLVVALLAAGALAWAITRSITRPVDDTVQLAERIASGDLSHTLAVARNDELGRLQQVVLGMQSQLSNLVGGIRRSADHIAVASAEIAGGSQHLSRRTEETASSLAETTGAMEQLAGSVRQSAASARSANEMTHTASQAAERGGSVVSQVVARMGEISAASGRIVDIIQVIDSIAFQTNILALNAAVEAARAGDHGKGFAVVAAEVRSLAHRSANAAREIKGLIDQSANQVEAGSKLVRDAGTTMREILAGVGRVTTIVNEICNTTDSQNTGLSEVSIAVTRLDDMTQQNAALVEQSAAAAESLRDQAKGLQELVNRFRLRAVSD